LIDEVPGQNVIDTVIHRGGGAAASWFYGPAGSLGLGRMAWVGAIAVGWLAVAWASVVHERRRTA
jgi:hypothetical protein